MSTHLAIASMAALAAIGALRGRGSRSKYGRDPVRVTQAGAEPQDAVSPRETMARLLRLLQPLSPRDLSRDHLEWKPESLSEFYRAWLRERESGYGRKFPNEDPDLLFSGRVVDEDELSSEDVDWFVESSSDEVISSFNEYMSRKNYDLGYYPSDEHPSLTFSRPRLLKDVWLIHHTNSSDLDDEGFRLGVSDWRSLPYTGGARTYAGQRPGYNFAYLPEDHERYGFGRQGPKYGSKIYAFWVPYAVYAYHHGDLEPQVIFWGPSARRIVEISQEDVPVGGGEIEERWIVTRLEELDGRTVSAETSEELVDWLKDNWRQYQFLFSTADRRRRRVERGWSAEVVGKKLTKTYYGDDREVDVQADVFRGPRQGSPRGPVRHRY